MTRHQKYRLLKRSLVLLTLSLLAWRGYEVKFGAKELHPVPAAIAEFVCAVQAYGSGPGQAPVSFGTEQGRIECPEARGDRPVIGR